MAKYFVLLKLFGKKGDTPRPRMFRETMIELTRSVVFLLASLAIISLIAEYGFYPSAELRQNLHTINIVVLYGFVGQGVLRLLLVEERIGYLKSRWFEYSLIGLILLYLLFPSQLAVLLLSLNPLLQPDAIARFYLALTQIFLFIAFIPAVLRYSKRLMTSNIQPSTLILLSFLALIGFGTLLLSLPRATVAQSLSFTDALFTATSAVCVTGLIVVDTATYFSPFGQTVLMILIQIGGLGIMTLTTFFAFVIGGEGRLKEYATLQSLLGEENLGRIKHTIVQIALATLIVEGIGALAFFYSTENISFADNTDRFFFSLFHSVSAFCNAGFTLTTRNLAETFFYTNSGVLVTVTVLIVLGGIGFPVLSNCASVIVSQSNTVSKKRLSLHSKLVLLTTFILIVAGTIGFFWLEQGKTLHDLSFGQQILTSLFHSVSARTAGFNTLDVGTFASPTLFILIVLMWIGASPGSTGGGIKTTTAAVAFLNIFAIASGRNKVEIFRKKVTDIAIVKAFSTILLSFLFVSVALFCLLLTERASLEALLFEVISAIGTVGLSTGITPQLTVIGKIIIIMCMFVGRVGLLAIVMALTRHRSEGSYEYTEENVLIT